MMWLSYLHLGGWGWDVVEDKSFKPGPVIEQPTTSTTKASYADFSGQTTIELTAPTERTVISLSD